MKNSSFKPFVLLILAYLWYLIASIQAILESQAQYGNDSAVVIWLILWPIFTMAFIYFGWRLSQQIKTDLLRFSIRCLLFSIPLAPTLIGGHGVVPCPAIMLVIACGLQPEFCVKMFGSTTQAVIVWGVVPLTATTFIFVLVGMVAKASEKLCKYCRS